jgi:hypothetical protein
MEFEKLMKRLSTMNQEYEDSKRQRDILISNLKVQKDIADVKRASL